VKEGKKKRRKDRKEKRKERKERVTGQGWPVGGQRSGEPAALGPGGGQRWR